MKIGGFQKFSLLDYPGQLSAIVFTQGCNFRCPYCHNPQLVDPARYGKTLDNSKVMEFLAGRRGRLGAVTISGGEPTLQDDLGPFIKLLRQFGYLIKVDTNGSNPDLIEALNGENLVDYWAMDVKAPADLYRVLTRSQVGMDSIVRSMDLLRGCGKPFEFRTTWFDRLFSWADIARIQELLKPGDKFILQECRYEHTLEDLKGAPAETSRPPLLSSPACRDLVSWGDRHRVNVRIRSL